VSQSYLVRLITMTVEKLSDDQLAQFTKDGFVAVPGFLNEAEVRSLTDACAALVEELDPEQHPATVFSSTDQQQKRGDYFLESGDKIRYFFEEDALGKDGKLKVPKHLSLNKVGHALHWLSPAFKEVSFSPRVKAVGRQLGFVSPAVVQSMYIFKQPGFGGEVTPHKDCTFLSTEPQSCVGLWFALEDATPDNGCMWFLPGSHHQPTQRRFVREEQGGVLSTAFTAPPDPADLDEYVQVPVKKGTLVLINGQVDHMSKRNTSSKSRHIYTFHMIERHNTTWDPRNWLQPTEDMPFTGLYEN